MNLELFNLMVENEQVPEPTAKDIAALPVFENRLSIVMSSYNARNSSISFRMLLNTEHVLLNNGLSESE